MVDPLNANVVYATTSYGINGIYGGWGIWKSTDGGNTWTNTTNSISSGTDPVMDLVIDPTNDNVLYGAMAYWGGNSYNGIYKSTNAGSSWSLLSAFPGDYVNNTASGRISLGMTTKSTVGTPVLYASVQSTSTYGVLGVYRSANGGTNWSTITPSFNYMGGQGWYDQYIAVSPLDSTQNTIFVAGSAGTGSVAESTNGGTTWTDISTGANGNNGPHADHHSAGFDASGNFLDGDDGGIWRLANQTIGSILWTDLNSNLGITQFQGIAIGNGTTPALLGGSQDNGTSKGSAAAVSLTEVEGGDGGLVSISPNNASRVYHIAPVGSFGPGDFFRRSTDGGNSWSSVPPSIGSDSTDFYPPFAIDPTYNAGGNDRVLLGTNHIYVSTNSASSWTELTTNTSNGWTSTSSIDTLASVGSTIYASAGGSTFVSTDGGTTWANRNVTGTAGISQIVVDPTNAQIAYAVLARFTGSLSGKVYRTTNGGTTWTDISGNLPDIPARSVVVDPNGGSSIVYVGTDSGVYLTSNLGASWQQLGNNLPGAAVYDLRENSNKVVAAGTHGRGIWYIPTTTTSTAIALAASPVIFGQTATFVATVSPSNGSGETGSVQFQIDGVNAGAPVSVSGNTASYSTSSLTLANHTITAGYSGDGNFVGSTSSLANVVPAIVVNSAGTLALSTSLTHVGLLTASVTLSGATGAWTATLDLTNNALDIISGSLSTVTNQVSQAFNGGNWLGYGITSSTAAANSLTGLGVIQNNQGGSPIFTALKPFDTLVPGASDILVKYTYYGDTNLDGKVDGSDYSRIDAGFLARTTGWFNGDFNYDNTINGSDYTLIDNAFNRQGASLAAQVSSVNTSTSINRKTLTFAESFASTAAPWFGSVNNVATQIFSTSNDDLNSKRTFGNQKIVL